MRLHAGHAHSARPWGASTRARVRHPSWVPCQGRASPRGRLLTTGAGTSAAQGRVARRMRGWGAAVTTPAPAPAPAPAQAPAPAPAPAPVLAHAPAIALSVATTTTPFPTVQPQAGRVSSATTSVLPGDSTARHAAGLANMPLTSEVLEMLRQEWRKADATMEAQRQDLDNLRALAERQREQAALARATTSSQPRFTP